MFLSVGASTEAKPLHVCSVGPVSTRHAVVCAFLAFIKISISPLTCLCHPDQNGFQHGAQAAPGRVPILYYIELLNALKRTRPRHFKYEPGNAKATEKDKNRGHKSQNVFVFGERLSDR